MLLRLLRYNHDVQYKKGSQMFIADHRSRASVCQELPTEKLDEVPIFAMELESMNPFDSI